MNMQARQPSVSATDRMVIEVEGMTCASETVQFPGVHCLPKRALLSAILGRGEAGCAGKSVLRVRAKSRKVTG